MKNFNLEIIKEKPGQKRFCWHKWHEDKNTGVTIYRRCLKCGKKQILQWNGFGWGYQPIDKFYISDYKCFIKEKVLILEKIKKEIIKMEKYLYRIFYKRLNDSPKQKSSKIEEIRAVNFQEAFSYAQKYAKQNGHRVVMVAELPADRL